MDSNMVLIILGIAAGLLLGGVFGFLLGGTRGRKKNKEADQEAAQRPAAKPPRPVSSGVVPPAALTDRVREDYRPIICLWRSRSTGKLATEIKGKLYIDLTPLSPEVKKKLQEIAAEWDEWVGAAHPDGVEILREEYTNQEQPAAPTSKSAAADPASQQTDERQEPTPLQLEEKPAERTPKVSSLSIVEQIDEILQEMLAVSETENRAIRLIEEPNQGVSVWVGLTRYHSIDEVEDPEALKIIKAAVAEWEKISGEKH
jgi:hypothetical protein